MTPDETLAHLAAIPGVVERSQGRVTMGADSAMETVVGFGAQGLIQVYHYDDGQVLVVARNYVRRVVMKWAVDWLTSGVLGAAVKWALAPLEMET